MPIKETELRETEASAPNAPQQHAICNGYGACSKSGCNCLGF